MGKQRIEFIDQVKILLTFLVVAHHAGQPYGETGGMWPVEETSKIEGLHHFFFLNAAFLMGLFFFISGYFQIFSLRSKNNRQFLTDRLKRLGIPLLFFTLFIFLPINYFSSDQSLSIFRVFNYTYFEKPPMAVGHLWFVASLLLYSIVYIPLDSLMVNRDRALTSLDILLFIAALTVVGAIVRQHYPVDFWKTWVIPLEVAHIPQYFGMYLMGSYFNKSGALDEITWRKTLPFFIAALAAAITRVTINVDSVVFEVFIETVFCVGLGLGLLQTFKSLSLKTNKFFKIVSQNSYGIYLVHVFVVITLQMLIRSADMSPIMKFFLVAFLGFLLSTVLSFVLRKIPLVRKVI